MRPSQHQTRSFGDFTLDLTRGCLLRGAEEVRLRPKSFEALKYLVENGGRLVSKDELMRAVWADTFVTDDSLVQCLIEIRRALADDSRRYIRTVPRRGYIFEAEVFERDPAGQAGVDAKAVEGVGVIAEEEARGVERAEAGDEAAAARRAEATGLPAAGAGRRRLASAVLAVSLLALGGLGAYLLAGRNQARDPEAIDSIVVLPFANAGGDPNAEYLSDGLSEALINSLTELRQLRVVARSTAFRYKGREVDPREVGRELRVRAVLMGRVRQTGDRLDVQVDLVDAATGAQVWGEGYERGVTDVLTVKQAIAREVTEKLRWKLSGEERRRLVKGDTANAEAYQLYLRGRFHWNKRTAKELRKATEYFRQAVTVDPNYALGHAGLADAYTQFSQFGDAPPREVMPKAKEAALRALSLDDGLAEARAALGLILVLYDYDLAAAERELKRAIELSPNYGTARHYYARLLSALGRHEEALAEIGRALESEPLSLPFNWFYGHALIHARRYDEGIAQLRRTQELDAAFPGVPFHLARAYQAKGGYAESVEEYARYLELSGEGDVAAAARESFARGGWRGYLRAMAERPGLSPFHRALFYAPLVEKDKAFDALGRAYEERDGLLIMYLKVDPRLDPLRDDPRFHDLMRRAGFPQ
jgi:TolB-like protein/DNA-binding winged helix-turn-helix (wHTH) protein/Tfp pilus assembly protein PilF